MNDMEEISLVDALRAEVKKLRLQVVLNGLGLLVTMIACSLFILKNHRSRVDVTEELEARPPVAVIDLKALSDSIRAENPGIGVQESMGHAYRIAERLASKGYLVIDRNMVMAYPKDIEVSQ